MRVCHQGAGGPNNDWGKHFEEGSRLQRFMVKCIAFRLSEVTCFAGTGAAQWAVGKGRPENTGSIPVSPLPLARIANAEEHRF